MPALAVAPDGEVGVEHVLALPLQRPSASVGAVLQVRHVAVRQRNAALLPQRPGRVEPSRLRPRLTRKELSHEVTGEVIGGVEAIGKQAIRW